jgi:hypothetical protein
MSRWRFDLRSLEKFMEATGWELRFHGFKLTRNLFIAFVTRERR